MSPGATVRRSMLSPLSFTRVSVLPTYTTLSPIETSICCSPSGSLVTRCSATYFGSTFLPVDPEPWSTHATNEIAETKPIAATSALDMRLVYSSGLRRRPRLQDQVGGVVEHRPVGGLARHDQALDLGEQGRVLAGHGVEVLLRQPQQHRGLDGDDVGD